MDRKPVIYLLPGLLCDRDVWQYQIPALEAAAEVRVPDFRGMTSLRDMAEKVLETAPEEFSVAGHSMGGRVALELVHRVPARLKHLILLSVGAHPVSGEERRQRTALVEQARRLGMRRFAEHWADLMLENREAADGAVRRCIETMAARQTLEVFAGHIRAGLEREDQSRYLPLIKQQVLLICGDRDAWSPVDQHAGIQAQIPGARLRVISGAGHMLTLEKPDEINTLLLERVSGRKVLFCN